MRVFHVGMMMLIAMALVMPHSLAEGWVLV